MIFNFQVSLFLSEYRNPGKKERSNRHIYVMPNLAVMGIFWKAL